MKTIEIDFTCPKCGEKQLAQFRERVTVLERLSGIRVMDKSSPGKKYNADLEGFRTEDDGAITGFGCECCGHRLVRTVTDRLTTKKIPVKSVLDLHRWLKQHNMIRETEEIPA